MNMDEKYLYNLVLRQLRGENEEDYDDDAEPEEYDIDIEDSPFFGKGELDQMEGAADEDEVCELLSTGSICPNGKLHSFPLLNFFLIVMSFRIDGCFDRDTHYVVPAYAVNHLWALFEEKQA